MEAYILQVTDYKENDAYIGGCFTCFARAAELMMIRVYEIGEEIEDSFLLSRDILAEAVVYEGLNVLMRCRIIKQDISPALS